MRFKVRFDIIVEAETPEQAVAQGYKKLVSDEPVNADVFGYALGFVRAFIKRITLGGKPK